MKNYLITLLLLLSFLQGFGQFKSDRFNAGISITKTEYLFQGDIKPALQAGLGYDITDKVGLYLSYFQSKTSTDPDNSFKADVVRFSTLIRIRSTYRSRFSFYIPLGVSVLAMTDITNKVPSKQTGATLDIPLGVQLKAGAVRLYGEFGLGVAMTKYKTPSIMGDYDNLYAQVGVKVPFGK